jgi:hypothetical protein
MKLFQKLAVTTAFTTLGLITLETNPSFAATFTVNNTFNSGAGSLRQAIIDANTTSGNDIIDFLLGSGSQTITTGELGITDNLVINGLGADLLTVGANILTDIFSIGNGANVEISGLSITGGMNGIFISSNSTATVTNSTIRSAFQDGISNAGKVTLINTNLRGNGDIGIGNSGTATLINSDVSSNYIAGILNSGTVTLTNSSVSGSNDGISNRGTVALTNSSVGGNRYGISNRGTTTVINSTFNGNDAGIVNEGTATVTNSTLSRNGAGIINEGTATVTNSTISDNRVGISAGFNNGGPTNIGNTIIAQNSTDLFIGIDTINDLGYNLIGNGEGSVFVNGVNGNIVGTAANPVNPLLGSLANNGGPTRTQALLPGSLAIDAANPSNFPTTDQRGVSRPQGARADIGAFEVVQTSPPPKSVPEPNALGGLAILGLFGLLRKKVRFSH